MAGLRAALMPQTLLRHGVARCLNQVVTVGGGAQGGAHVNGARAVMWQCEQRRFKANRSSERKMEEIAKRYADWSMPERKESRPLEARRVTEFKQVVHAWVPPADLTYTVRPELVRAMNASGWAPPAGLDGQVLPFHVFRTYKAEQLPVYTDFRAKRMRVYTVIRRVRGDLYLLAKEVAKICDGREPELHAGSIRVKGNFSQPLKYWLTSLGF
ncbi:putative 39S ribosomal protein L49, mitochondrial [Porphyridium purpureum]|uniref:Large ribosomal subunit protein mL49 n=1 Tax=Porphyridium purpureum TaxID=35688 RepID=A0A5J4YR81_PORPP|nr:putative 39S ribosomal protein L49, mitochondrial [Porphyridium purpureum]|eukprot:POR2413..scf296_7